MGKNFFLEAPLIRRQGLLGKKILVFRIGPGGSWAGGVTDATSGTAPAIRPAFPYLLFALLALPRRA